MCDVENHHTLSLSFHHQTTNILNFKSTFNMNPLVAFCLLATAALASAQGYGSSYGGVSSYGNGWGHPQPPTSQSYAGPGHHYGSQPVAYTAPAVTFNPPKIQYSEPTITYSTPNRVPVPVLNSYGSGSYGGGSSYSQRAPSNYGGSSSYGGYRR